MPAQAEQTMALFGNAVVDHPPVSTGTTVQYTSSWEDSVWYPAKVIHHYGNGHCTIEVNDPLSGGLVEKNNVLFVGDPDAKSQLYKENCLDLGDGGLWKATDDQSAIFAQLKELSERVGGLEALQQHVAKLAPKANKTKPSHTVDVDNEPNPF